MKFNIICNTYFNDESIASKIYFTNISIDENFAKNLLTYINKMIIKNINPEGLSMISIHTKKFYIVFDVVEIIIKAEDKSFDFEKYYVELYNEFEKQNSM